MTSISIQTIMSVMYTYFKLLTSNSSSPFVSCSCLQCENIFNILVGFVALRPKSTAMVIAGRSVHLTTLFPGQA